MINCLVLTSWDYEDGGARIKGGCGDKAEMTTNEEAMQREE